MKPGTLGKLALAVWAVTLMTLGWFFINGNTERPGADGRTIIRLNPAERDLVLKEMRALLSATHGILQGISEQDLQRISEQAHAVGMAAAADVNPALMAKLPLSFKSLGMSVHRDMDEISRAASAGEPPSKLLKQLTATMSKCVACHDRWQLSLGEPAGNRFSN